MNDLTWKEGKQSFSLHANKQRKHFSTLDELFSLAEFPDGGASLVYFQASCGPRRSVSPQLCILRWIKVGPASEPQSANKFQRSRFKNKLRDATLGS